MSLNNNIMKNQNLKNKTADVSIVMATYNGEEFLSKQLDTILDQTILPCEIIIMDDNSSDDTVLILENYRQKFVGIGINYRVILRNSNVGYINNFIDGIEAAKNDLVILSDQDDEWVKTKIEFISKFFKETKDCIALHTDTHIIDRESKILRKKVQGYHNTKINLSITEFIRKINYPGMALAFNKRKVLPDLLVLKNNNVNFPTHDWVICFISVLKNGFYISNQVLTYRRFTGNNVALTLSDNRISNISKRIDGIKLYMKHYHFIKNSHKYIEFPLAISHYISTAENRIHYLEKKSIVGWLKNIYSISYYPSYKSYLADLILLVK